MTATLWRLMCDDALLRIPKGTPLVSGGAAWADHLAVYLFLNGHTDHLTLHLPAPAPTKRGFAGTLGTAGCAANHYHRLFSEVIGRSSMLDIMNAIERGAQYTTQPTNAGLCAFKIRNLQVAQDATTAAFAYTWGNGKAPVDGGTAHTWRILKCPKLHIPLAQLEVLGPGTLFQGVEK
jgi:hypothetical protein